MKVSELLALKIENIALRMQALQREQEWLLAQARAEVKAPADCTIYDLATRMFTPPRQETPE